MRTPLFLLLALLPFYAVANEKPFKIRNHDGFYKSVEAACSGFDYSKVGNSTTVVNPSYAGSYSSASGSTTTFVCKYNFYYHPYGNPENPLQLSPSPTSGSVVVDTMPACAAGTESTYTWPLGRRDSSAEFNIAPGTEISPPAFACIDGCKAQHQSVSSCFNESETDGSITYCDYNAKLTGESCTTSENQPPEVPQPTDPGDGGTDPGDGGTDPGDGGTDPGDGGTDPGDGGTDPGDGGTNPGDGGTNPGDGGTNPGDGGTNPGDGGTNPGGGDSDGNSASGVECSQPLACSGDAIQCAIFETQKRARCDALTAGDFPAQEGDITGFINGKGDSAKLDEGDGEIDVSGLFSGPTDPRFLPATCPAAKTVTLTSQGGRTFEFTYEPLCQFATDLGYLIVIAASLFYAVYVGRASGGE